MHAGDMAWVLPELVWHLEDLRVGMSLPEPLHRAARVEVRQGRARAAPAATSSSPAIRGATSCVAGLRGADEFERALLRLLEPARPGRRARVRSSRPTSRGARRRPAAFDVFREALAPAAGLDPLAKALYFEAKTFLHGLLVVEDRVSMAHSLEVRVPFLDNALVDARAADPVAPEARRRRRQALLRERDARRCCRPRSSRSRKQGFSPPDESWYRGPTMDYIRELLLDPRTPRARLLPAGGVQRVLEEHARGPRQPPAADLVAALLRVVEPALRRRRARRTAQRLARGSRAPARLDPADASPAPRRPARAPRRRPRVPTLARLAVVVAPLARLRTRASGRAILWGTTPIANLRNSVAADRAVRATRASRSSTASTTRPTARRSTMSGSRSAVSRAAAARPVPRVRLGGAALRRLLLLLRRRPARGDAVLAARSCRCCGSPARGSSSGRTAATRAFPSTTRARGGWHAYSDVPAGAEDRDEADVRAHLDGVRPLGERRARLRRPRRGPAAARRRAAVPVRRDAAGDPSRRPDDGVVRVVHAPNHPHYKGTRYLEAAVAALRAEGLPRRARAGAGSLERGGAARVRARGRRRRPVPDRRVRALRDRGDGARQAGALLPQPALRPVPPGVGGRADRQRDPGHARTTSCAASCSTRTPRGARRTRARVRPARPLARVFGERMAGLYEVVWPSRRNDGSTAADPDLGPRERPLVVPAEGAEPSLDGLDAAEDPAAVRRLHARAHDFGERDPRTRVGPGDVVGRSSW